MDSQLHTELHYEISVTILTYMNRNFITIVSGLPRSGTSMMMRMLEAGGMPVLADHQRATDEDNPKGYYEFEAVKKTAEDDSWLQRAKGAAVKMVYRLLYDLPPNYHYRVLYMRRNMEEVLASQRAMLSRSGDCASEASDQHFALLFQREIDKSLQWLKSQDHFEYVEVDYNQMLTTPHHHIMNVSIFLGGDLDTDAMYEVVDPSLYRQRSS